MELSDERIDYRKGRWLSDYKIDGIQTGICRIRIFPNPMDPIGEIKKVVDLASSNGNLRRSAYVVVNFLSKKELRASIELIKVGNQFAQKGVTLQILWFVYSLLSSAIELNTEFRIICRP